MSELHREIYSQDFQPDGQPYGWIQWKGTDACIDLHCSCGHHGHVDADFFYFYECPNCKAKYAVGQNVKLIKLNDEQIKYAKEGVGFTTSEPE
jgi:hypothetical protein